MSQLLIVRHGKAGDFRSFYNDTRLPDEERPLTKEGQEEMREIAQRLGNFVEPTRFVSSPLKRAVQTMDIIAKAFDGRREEAWQELTPLSNPENFLKHWIKHRKSSEEILAIAGHEPHLSSLISLLLSGESRSFVHVKKGGATLLDFSNGLDAGGAYLHWHLTPGQLRKLTP